MVQRPKRLSGMVVRRMIVMMVGGEGKGFSGVEGGRRVKDMTQRAMQAGIWKCYYGVLIPGVARDILTKLMTIWIRLQRPSTATPISG